MHDSQVLLPTGYTGASGPRVTVSSDNSMVFAFTTTADADQNNSGFDRPGYLVRKSMALG
jgi:hypothetical protein